MTQRKIKKIKFYSVFVSLIFLLLTLYLEFQTCPTFVTNFIKEKLSKKGYELNFKACYIRLWGKSEINDFSINSNLFDLNGKNLKINFSIINFILNGSIIKDFYGNDIAIHSQISLKQKQTIFVPNTNFKGRVVKKNILIDSLSFLLFNTSFKIKGILPLNKVINSNKSTHSSFSPEWKLLLQKINHLKKTINFSKNNITYNINFNLTEGNQKITNYIEIPSFSHNDVKCEQIKLEFAYLPKTQIIDMNKVSIILNENEKIDGSFLIDTKLQTLSSTFYINATPQTISNLISKEFTKEINPYLPQFNQKLPPKLLVNIRKAPLKEIKKWTFQGNLTVENCTLNGLKIDEGECKFNVNLAKKTIQLTEIKIINQNLRSEINLLLDFYTKTIFVDAKGQGDPRLFNHFVWDNPLVRKKIISIWDGFDWSKQDLPKFSFRFINTLKDSKWYKEPDVITQYNTITTDSKNYKFKSFLEGNIKAKNFTYNNQKIESADSDFYVKIPQFIMLRNIKLKHKSGKVKEGLYVIEDNSRLLNFKSLSSLTFLNSVSPSPITLPSIIEYSSNPIIEFSGIFEDKEEKVDIKKIDAVYTFPRVKILQNPATNNHGQLSVEKKQAIITSTGEVHGGKYSSVYKQKIDELLGKIKAQVENIDLTKFIKTYENNSSFITAVGKVFGYVDLILDYDVPKEKPINVFGEGHSKISKGAFAEIPLLSFLNAKSSLAKVTKVTAPKLLFENQRIYTPENVPITTNGSFLAFAINGEFDWDTLGINFIIRPRFFKDIKILTPLGYITKFKATGPIHSPDIKLNW